MKISKNMTLPSYNILFRLSLEKNHSGKNSGGLIRKLVPIIEKLVKRLFDAKIIVTLGFSKWVSNLVPIWKKNGEIRLCVDFGNLNKVYLKDNYPFPKMDQILQRVVGSERISTMDGFSGYNQVKVFPEDQEKTTFTTPWGTFMYANMPFGSMNAGATSNVPWILLL